jgi:hypothetical protein
MISRREFLAGVNTAIVTNLIPTIAHADNDSAVTMRDQRIALLIGNREYPSNFDLPSMQTNVKGLALSLTRHEFSVTTLIDAQRMAHLDAIKAFVKKAEALPPDGIALFYFCGHGVQVDAENFLLPSGVTPSKRSIDESYNSYVALWRDLLESMPKRQDLLVVTVLDCCRSSPKPITATDGLNQVRAPSGELIVFSTGSGRFALAPIDPDKYTFFTGALVNRLDALHAQPEELSFADMFRLVGNDVYESMSNSPLQIIRTLAQQPFIADSTLRGFKVSTPRRISAPSSSPLPSTANAPGIDSSGTTEEDLFRNMGNSTWPDDVRKSSEILLKAYPSSRYRSEAMVARIGAIKAKAVLADPNSDINLDVKDFKLSPGHEDQEYAENLRRSGRGDKDAAVRIAQRHVSRSDPVQLSRYEAWLQFAGLLGDGIACYELSRHYNDLGMPAEAGKWSSRAKRFGYNAPAQLRTTR